jgi:putative acetyltransferase
MPEYQLRPASTADMPAVARLHRRVRLACLPYLPELHTPQEDLAFFTDHVFPRSTILLAEAAGELIGFSVTTPNWLDHLYVCPAWHGRGVGRALLAAAKTQQPELNLWTFQKNSQARLFYETQGFALIALTDGSSNEEKEPDAHYRWAEDRALSNGR